MATSKKPKAETYFPNTKIRSELTALKNKLGYATLPKRYVALVTQSSTGAPTVVVLENTLGGTVVWTRNAAGDYRGTLSAAFPAQKIFGSVTFAGTDGTSSGALGRVDNNSVALATYAGNVATDGLLNNASVEIRVYP